VLVPPEYRERKTESTAVEPTRIVLDLSGESYGSAAKRSKPAAGIVLAVVILVVVCTVVGAVLSITGMFTGTALFAAAELPTRAAAGIPTIGLSIPTTVPQPPSHRCESKLYRRREERWVNR
jgi:hypothetical protein